MPKRTVDTPCEPNLLLSLENESTVDEHKRVLARGYQSAVGMCLWAARCIKPECLYTMGQLCKVMSKPTKEAWKAVMHLIAYMYQHRHEGITFSSNGNHIPFFMTDASTLRLHQANILTQPAGLEGLCRYQSSISFQNFDFLPPALTSAMRNYVFHGEVGCAGDDRQG